MTHTAEGYQAQVLNQINNGDVFEILKSIKECYSLNLPIETAVDIINNNPAYIGLLTTIKTKLELDLNSHIEDQAELEEIYIKLNWNCTEFEIGFDVKKGFDSSFYVFMNNGDFHNSGINDIRAICIKALKEYELNNIANLEAMR